MDNSKAIFLRQPEILTAFNYGKTTLQNRVKEGLLPPPISLGGRAVGWLKSEIDQIINLMIKGRSNTDIKKEVKDLVELRQLKLFRGQNA